MRKEIQQYGNSNVIVLNKSDLKVYGLKVGNIIELTITGVIDTQDCFPSSQPSNKSKRNIQTKKEKKQ